MKIILKLLFVFSVLVSSYSNVWAQSQAKIDSLLQEADHYKFSNPDSLELVLKELKPYANNKSELAQILVLKQVESLLTLNHLTKADSLLKTIDLSEKNGNAYVDYLVAKGEIMSHSGQPNQALELFYTALTLAKGIQYYQIMPNIYIEIALVLRQNNDIENTFKQLHLAVAEAQKQQNTKAQVNALIWLCKAYNGWLILNLDSSVYYGQKAIEVAKRVNYKLGVIEAQKVVPAPIIRLGKYREGLEMSKNVLKYADSLNFSLKERCYLTANIAFAYEYLGKIDSAKYFANLAKEIRPESLDNYRLMYTILKAEGNYKLALEQLETYLDKYIILIGERNKKKLSELQARYEANFKEQEINALTRKNELQNLQLSQQRYLITGLSLLVLLIVGGVYLAYRQKQLKLNQHLTNLELVETKKRLELEKQFRASELKAIRSQMNPHFLFNALNSIQEYIVSNERKLAGKYLGKFADLMRIYLEHSQVKSVTLREEIEAMKLYLELEKLRFEDAMQFEITIAADVNEETILPSMFLQPYVENAIKHGLLHKKNERQLKIDIKQDENYLICTIQDNGIGRAESLRINKIRKKSHASFAMQATKSRLELLNQDRTHPIQEQIVDLKDENNQPLGTKVVLKIPLFYA